LPRTFSAAAAESTSRGSDESVKAAPFIADHNKAGVNPATDTFFKANEDLIFDLSEFLIRNYRDRAGFTRTSTSAVWDNNISRRKHLKEYVPANTGDLAVDNLVDDDDVFEQHCTSEDRRLGDYLGSFLHDEDATLDYSPLTLYLCLCHLRQLSESFDQVRALQTMDVMWRQHAWHDSGWAKNHYLEGLIMIDEKSGSGTSTSVRTGRGKNFVLKLFEESCKKGYDKSLYWKSGFTETQSMSSIWKKHMQDRIGLGKVTQLQGRLGILWHEDFNRTDYKSHYITTGAKFESRLAQSCLEVGKAMGLSQHELGLNIQDQFEEVKTPEERRRDQLNEKLYKGMDAIDLKYGAINPMPLPEKMMLAKDAMEQIAGVQPAPPLESDAQRLMCAQVASCFVHSEVKSRAGEIVVCPDVGDLQYDWASRDDTEDETEVDAVAQVVQNLADDGIKFFTTSAYSRKDIMADPLTAVLADVCNVIEFKDEITPHGNGFFYSDSPLIAKKMEQFKKEYRYA